MSSEKTILAPHFVMNGWLSPLSDLGSIGKKGNYNKILKFLFLLCSSKREEFLLLTEKLISQGTQLTNW